MKPSLLRLVISVFIVSLVLACSKPEPPPTMQDKLVGEWAGGGVTVIFNADGTFKMVRGNRVMAGEVDGKNHIWHLDDKQSPVALDMIIPQPNGKVEREMRQIMRWVTDDKIQLQVSRNYKRPEAFDDANMQMVLDRQK